MSPKVELVAAFLFLALISLVSGFACISLVPQAADPEMVGVLALVLLILCPLFSWTAWDTCRRWDLTV